MLPRRVFAILTTILIVLAVTTVVILGCEGLLSSMDDADGLRVMRWIRIASIVGLAVDSLLLLGALGLKAASQDEG